MKFEINYLSEKVAAYLKGQGQFIDVAMPAYPIPVFDLIKGEIGMIAGVRIIIK